MKPFKNQSLLLSIVIALFLVSSFTGLIAKEKLDPDSKEFYNYARYFFTKNEREIFLNLPNKDLRVRFIEYFWDIRDPNPLTEENEFKVEIEKRYEYVSRYLKEGPIPGWKSDRGRIYLLLGAPHQIAEDHLEHADIIYWYFEDTDIITRFIDTTGHGIYTMDLSYTSLKLLDLMEKNKHYIATREDSKFSVGTLNFKMHYNESTKEMIFTIKAKEVNFEKQDPTQPIMTAKFKIAFMIYGGPDNISKSSDIKTITANEADLLKDNAYIEVKYPLSLPKGNLKIDAIVTDFLGNATSRDLIKVKVK